MLNEIHVTPTLVDNKAETAARAINIFAGNDTSSVQLYPVSRKGLVAAYAIARYVVPACYIVESPELATVFIDAIINTGRTMATYCDSFPGVPFITLFEKSDFAANTNARIVLPWEQQAAYKVDPGLADVEKAMKELTNALNSYREQVDSNDKSY